MQSVDSRADLRRQKCAVYEVLAGIGLVFFYGRCLWRYGKPLMCYAEFRKIHGAQVESQPQCHLIQCGIETKDLGGGLDGQTLFQLRIDADDRAKIGNSRVIGTVLADAIG